MRAALMPNYARLPVAFERGEGVWLWDAQGRRYLDALSGLAVCSLGHAHPAVTRALREQSERLIHVSNLYEVPEQARLAERLTALSGLHSAFFCNSGTEANEAAIKLVRRQARANGVRRPTIITLAGAFHGRTLAPLAAAKWRDYRRFAPLPGGFKRAPFGDLDALREVIDKTRDACAVMFEPIQGEGGVRVLDDEYLRGARRLCDERRLWLVLDEVQTGICRTGAWFAYQHADILPDILLSAKALGNGMPIGACLARAPLAFAAGEHGTTFGGNPLASAVATAVLRAIEDDGLLENATRVGDHILRGLRDGLKNNSFVREVRGRGMMIGVELKKECSALVAEALKRGLLINVTSDKVIRLLPPLIMKTAEADTLIDIVVSLVRDFAASHTARRATRRKNA